MAQAAWLKPPSPVSLKRGQTKQESLEKEKENDKEEDPTNTLDVTFAPPLEGVPTKHKKVKMGRWTKGI